MRTLKEGLDVIRYRFNCETCGHEWEDSTTNPKVSVGGGNGTCALSKMQRV